METKPVPWVFSKEGDPLVFGEEPVIGEGVTGTAFDMPDGIYISLITAIKEGNGDVGRFIDALPRDRRIVFPNIISHRLAGMLGRRGYVQADEMTPDGPIDVFVKEPEKTG